MGAKGRVCLNTSKRPNNAAPVNPLQLQLQDWVKERSDKEGRSMTEMEYIPELYQDDEAFTRMRKLLERVKLFRDGLRVEDLNSLLERMNQAFEFSLLPITEVEQTETIATLRGHHPIVWDLVQKINQEGLNAAEGTFSLEGARNSVDAPLLNSEPTKFEESDYKTCLKKSIITLDQNRKYICKRVDEVLRPHWWGKPLSKENAQYQKFVEDRYSKAYKEILIFLIGVVVTTVLIFSFIMYMSR